MYLIDLKTQFFPVVAQAFVNEEPEGKPVAKTNELQRLRNELASLRASIHQQESRGSSLRSSANSRCVFISLYLLIFSVFPSMPESIRLFLIPCLNHSHYIPPAHHSQLEKDEERDIQGAGRVCPDACVPGKLSGFSPFALFSALLNVGLSMTCQSFCSRMSVKDKGSHIKNACLTFHAGPARATAAAAAGKRIAAREDEGHHEAAEPEVRGGALKS